MFPILLYNGSERWTVPQNVRELIEPTIAPRYIPSFEYYAIIEQDIPDETLQKIRGILSAVMYLEKRRDDVELRNAVDRVIDMVEAEQPEQLRMFKVWLNRMFRAAMSVEQQDRINKLRGVKNMLSEVIDQMERKYRHEERRKHAVRMLRKGYPLEDVMEITELSRDEADDLAEQIAAEEDTNGD